MKKLALILTLTAALAACSPSVVRHPSAPRPVASWQRVSSDLADALAEGDAPDAGSRQWEDCQYRKTTNGTVVVCPDGFVHIDPSGPNCPTEDSCYADYSHGKWTIRRTPAGVACDTFDYSGRVTCVDGRTGRVVGTR